MSTAIERQDRSILGRSPAIGTIRLPQRQLDRKHGSLPFLAFDCDRSPMVLNNRLDNRKPNASSTFYA